MSFSDNHGRRRFYEFRFSSLLITLLAVTSFVAGVFLVKYPDLIGSSQGAGNTGKASTKQVSSLELLIKVFGSPTLVLAFLAVINRRVNQEIEIEVHDITRDTYTKLEGELKTEFHEGIKELRNKIQPYLGSSKISPEAKQEIDECFAGIYNLRKDWRQNTRVCDDIGSWLSDSKNLAVLLNYLCNGDVGEKVPSRWAKEFKENLRQCLLWLRYSLQDHSAYTLEIDRCGSAIGEGKLDFEVYQDALNKLTEFEKIKSQLENPQRDLDYLKKWVEDLLFRMQKALCS